MLIAMQRMQCELLQVDALAFTCSLKLARLETFFGSSRSHGYSTAIQNTGINFSIQLINSAKKKRRHPFLEKRLLKRQILNDVLDVFHIERR